jgi:poly-gamma-glutamate synthesis protein (capsule biosynthesis protein)
VTTHNVPDRAAGRGHNRHAALAVVSLLLSAAACTPDRAPAGTGPSPAGPHATTANAKPTRTAKPAISRKPSPTPATAPVRPVGRPVTIAFGGDVHFEGASRSALGGLGAISDVLSDADLAVVNLETAVTTGGSPSAKEYNFRAPPSAFDALKSSGVDVATMANNHGMDYGVPGLRDSLRHARAADFPVIGIGADESRAYAPYRTTINGQRIAVIGATQVMDTAFIRSWTAGPDKPGLASAKDEARIVEAVRAARGDSDTVVVFLHWGAERVSCPTDVQRHLAAKLLAAGADIVVGAHAHVRLGSGWLGEGYVNYGLGNFVFYARPGEGAQTGVLVLTVRGRAVEREEWRPAEIRGGRPVLLTGTAAARSLASWRALRKCAGLADRRA